VTGAPRWQVGTRAELAARGIDLSAVAPPDAADKVAEGEAAGAELPAAADNAGTAGGKGGAQVQTAVRTPIAAVAGRGAGAAEKRNVGRVAFQVPARCALRAWNFCAHQLPLLLAALAESSFLCRCTETMRLQRVPRSRPYWSRPPSRRRLACLHVPSCAFMCLHVPSCAFMCLHAPAPCGAGCCFRVWALSARGRSFERDALRALSRWGAAAHDRRASPSVRTTCYPHGRPPRRWRPSPCPLSSVISAEL
jgi:hypothetical protein